MLAKDTHVCMDHVLQFFNGEEDNDKLAMLVKRKTVDMGEFYHANYKIEPNIKPL